MGTGNDSFVYKQKKTHTLACGGWVCGGGAYMLMATGVLQLLVKKNEEKKNPKHLQNTGHAWATAVPMHKQSLYNHSVISW